MSFIYYANLIGIDLTKNGNAIRHIYNGAFFVILFEL